MKQHRNTIIFGILFLLAFAVVPVETYAQFDLGGSFWEGLWHGVTLPFRLLLKFVWPDIVIFTNNFNNSLYHFGYLVGFIAIGGFTFRASSSKR